MKSVFKASLLGLLLSLPLSTAYAQAPSVSPISNIFINAGVVSTVNVVAIDANNDPITLTALVPAFVILNAPTTGTGVVSTTLTLNPLATDVGTHTGRVIASAGGATDTTTFLITVSASGSNQAPVVTAPAVRSTDEGVNLNFTVAAVDADADAILSLTASPLPSGATFTPNGTNTAGTFSWTPSSTQSGDYDVTFTATSGVLTGAATTHIDVENVALSTPPSISPISNISINAGAVSTRNVVAIDANNDFITLTAQVPAFVTLNAPTTGTGFVSTTMTLAPMATDVGTHTGRVIASAGGASDTTTFLITVSASGSNQAPVVTAPAVRSTNEGVNLNFTVSAVDADADAILSLTASPLPSGATFTPNGTNTAGTFSWTPSSTQSGDYDVTFTATSGVLSGAATTHIDVENVAVPTLSIAEINNVTLAEGATLTVNVNVTGPASGTIALTSALPSFAVLNAPTSSTGTGTLATTVTISPPVGTVGTHTASITATAGLETDTETFTITVTPVGGGGLQATATMIGNFNTHKKFICFRVKPVNESFDMRNVMLTGVTLSLNGTSITAGSKTHLTWECQDDDDGEDDSDGDCDECEHEDGEHDEDCDGDCEAQLKACFAMSDIRDSFEGANLPGDFVNATLTGTLSTGGTFVATIGAKFAGNNGHGNKKGMGSKVRPNPVNPNATVTFRLSQPGRVRVAIYDLQGRLVKTLLDENRTAGDQSVTWNGSSARSATVPSGVYFVKIKAPQGEEVQRVTVLK